MAYGSMHRRPAPQSDRELLVRAEALAARSVAEVAHALGMVVPASSRQGKGFVGQLVERALGADPHAGRRPDFLALNVELKTIPINAWGYPAESTFCCSVAMSTADQECWETSCLKQRLSKVLWMPVTAARLAPLPARRLGHARLWIPSCEVEGWLRADWEDLIGAIALGRGGSLSAREGRILQVRPKAADASVRTWAPGPEGPLRMLPLGFYLRPSFTAKILRGEL